MISNIPLWIPTFIILILISPAFYRFAQIVYLKRKNRWRSNKTVYKTRNIKIRAKALKYAQTYDGKYLLNDLVQNKYLTAEEVNTIALISNHEARIEALKSNKITTETINTVAKEENLNYHIWYLLTDSEKLEESIKVFLCLRYPEFAENRRKGIEPNMNFFGLGYQYYN